MNKPFIIAEIGSNHNGDFDKLSKLIEQAKRIGSNAVKFQLFKIDDLNITNSKKKRDLKKIEFKIHWISKIKKICKKNNIELIFSFFNYDYLKLIQDNTKCNYLKIASSECNNYELISKIQPNVKNIILSIGMTLESEIIKTKEILKMNGISKIIAMHCVSDYPTLDKNLNLNYLKKLHNFGFDEIGLSDHTLDDLAAVTSVGLGAKYFEKHITLNKDDSGPDHFYALEPNEFKSYINNINRSFSMLGKMERVISKDEIKYGRRKGIYSSRNLKKGHTLRSADIIFKTPSTGLRDIYVENIINKKINKNINKNHPISLFDIEK